MRSLRGLIQAWHAAREQGLAAIPDEEREPLETEFRRAVTVGLAAVSRVPGPKNQVRQQPGRGASLEFCKSRQGDVLRFAADTSVWPTNNISERGVRPLKTQQKISGRLTSGQRHPGQARHPRLHRHRPQARPRRLRGPAPAHAR